MERPVPHRGSVNKFSSANFDRCRLPVPIQCFPSLAEEQRAVSEDVDRQTGFIRDLVQNLMIVSSVFVRLEKRPRQFIKSAKRIT